MTAVEQTPDVEIRKGRVLRVTTSRTVSCACADCDLITDNTGAAASHARSARHRVDCTYATTFALVPVETVVGASA